MSKGSGQYEVLGIGAPVIDLVLQVPDAFLKALSGTKHGMQGVSSETIQQLIAQSQSTPSLRPGGSAANTIKGLARLGHRTALFGKIGTDVYAEPLIDSLEAHGVQPLLLSSETATTQVVILVAPNGERTFRTFFGAGYELTQEELAPLLFQNVHLVHLEGYSLLNSHVFERTLEMAEAAGCTISLDLGSHEIVTSHRQRILDALPNIDLLFCNRDELMALLQSEPEVGCDQLCELCTTVVILLGKEGCLVGRGTERTRCAAYPANVLDTTGAGDLFASGFLHGFLTGRSLELCAHFGTILGGAITEVLGAELSEKEWLSLKNRFVSDILRKVDRLDFKTDGPP